MIYQVSVIKDKKCGVKSLNRPTDRGDRKVKTEGPKIMTKDTKYFKRL